MLLEPKEAAGRDDDQANHAEKEESFHGANKRV
jgi:hypothetical protein